MCGIQAPYWLTGQTAKPDIGWLTTGQMEWNDSSGQWSTPVTDWPPNDQDTPGGLVADRGAVSSIADH